MRIHVSRAQSRVRVQGGGGWDRISSHSSTDHTCGHLTSCTLVEGGAYSGLHLGRITSTEPVSPFIIRNTVHHHSSSGSIRAYPHLRFHSPDTARTLSLRWLKMKIDTSLTMPQLPETLAHTGLQFTVATEEDFDDIMAMSQDIYGGLDYLPTRYSSWLQETNRIVILARKHGKVIALESVCVIDDGETVLVEGLRVAPQERGKGVAGVLLRFCSELIKSRYPNVKVTRLTRDDQLGPKDYQKYRIITKQGILLVRFRAEELKQRLSELGIRGDIHSSVFSSSHSAAPVRLDHNTIQRLYLSTDLMHSVLPNATIIQDWQPFKLLSSNMAILLKKDVDWLVDDVTNPSVASLCTFPFNVPIGDDWYYLNIDMFGKELALVRQQLLCHLQRHTNTLKGHVMCQLFLEPLLWENMADFCQHTLGVELVKEYREQCVVEADMM